MLRCIPLPKHHRCIVRSKLPKNMCRMTVLYSVDMVTSGDLRWPVLDLTRACHISRGLSALLSIQPKAIESKWSQYLAYPSIYSAEAKGYWEQMKPISSLAQYLQRRGKTNYFWPLTSAWPDPWPRFSKTMHALVSSRWELSNAVYRLSLRCVVLEILADPNRTRLQL